MLLPSHVDSCNIKNGDCDANADCSHDSVTNVVQCACKTGFTNTASDVNVACTGTINKLANGNCVT